MRVVHAGGACGWCMQVVGRGAPFCLDARHPVQDRVQELGAVLGHRLKHRHLVLVRLGETLARRRRRQRVVVRVHGRRERVDALGESRELLRVEALQP